MTKHFCDNCECEMELPRSCQISFFTVKSIDKTIDLTLCVKCLKEFDNLIYNFRNRNKK